jgi:hypothetical protein
MTVSAGFETARTRRAALDRTFGGTRAGGQFKRQARRCRRSLRRIGLVAPACSRNVVRMCGMRTDSLLERSAILQRLCDDPTLSAGIVGAAAGSGRGRDHPQGLPRSSLEPLGIVREFARSEFLNSREQNSLQAR